MLSASSVDAAVSREQEPEPTENQKEQGDWEAEKNQALVVVMDDVDMIGHKSKSLSDLRQSSGEESHHCSAGTEAGTEPEPSTEQSSGTRDTLSTHECDVSTVPT